MAAFRVGDENEQKCHHRFRAGDGIMRCNGEMTRRYYRAEWDGGDDRLGGGMRYGISSLQIDIDRLTKPSGINLRAILMYQILFLIELGPSSYASVIVVAFEACVHSIVAVAIPSSAPICFPAISTGAVCQPVCDCLRVTTALYVRSPVAFDPVVVNVASEVLFLAKSVLLSCVNAAD